MSLRTGASAVSSNRRTRLVVALTLLAGTVTALPATPAAAAGATVLTAEEFAYGTYVIDEPGVYRLGEDITFNPNSPARLTADAADGTIPSWLASALDLPTPVDAYHAGFPLFTQLAPGGVDDFEPGGPLDARYDPAAYGVGFFAAISVTADDVTIDLGGHTIAQSPEHALLQRFFSVIELADQPFIPAQGPFDFGDGIDSANRVTIKNGTIGLSSHHGIHGNGNEDIRIRNVDFVGYEVGAIALNGVRGLDVIDVTATNRTDVPVLGTFSSAQFIKHVVNEVARNGSPTTLQVDGRTLDVHDVQAELRTAINNTHTDIIASPNVVRGRAQIDPVAHPVEYGLFHNRHGVVDGNSYSFLINSVGVAVNGFPSTPDGVTTIPAENIFFRNVHVQGQRAFVNEVPAISVAGVAAIDPIGAVFQIRNLDPATGEPVTISDMDDAAARYTGNPVANAQAFVAKANLNGEFGSSQLDLSRLNIPASVLDWVEAEPGAETLAEAGVTYVCNGDSMFHVNKGAIAFKMDAARDVHLVNTSVTGLHNLGEAGTTRCGDYLEGTSHPSATLPGYGGAVVRGYTFAGTHHALVADATVRDITAHAGSAFGFDIITDSGNVRLVDVALDGAGAGWGGPIAVGSPTKAAKVYGIYVGADATAVQIIRPCTADLNGLHGAVPIDDASGTAQIVGTCRGAR